MPKDGAGVIVAPMRLPALIAAALLGPSHAKALDIQFTVDTNGITAEGLAGFQAAAQIWEGLLHDPVTVNVTIGLYNFGAGNENIIGQAGSNYVFPDYADFRARMLADATGATDAAVTGTLAAGTTYSRLINQTNDTPGPDYFATWVDSGTDYVAVNRANAKALGLLAANAAGEDAAISFNSQFTFDYDRSNGISAGQMDFIGVALHELGHALGFVSIVDYIDQVAGNAIDFPSMPMDFLRYSAESEALGIHDVSAGTTAKYLKVGDTSLAMSTGSGLGDGQQASHFKDQLVPIGGMDPTTGSGVMLVMNANDLLVFDAIGWDLTAVPEPSAYGLGLGGLALGLAAIRRRRVG